MPSFSETVTYAVLRLRADAKAAQSASAPSQPVMRVEASGGHRHALCRNAPTMGSEFQTVNWREVVALVIGRRPLSLASAPVSMSIALVA